MRVPIDQLPEDAIAISGRNGVVMSDDLVVRVEVDGDHIVLYPERAAKQRILAKRLGYAVEE